MSLSKVPDLQNGLLQPPTTATRDPVRGEIIQGKVVTLVASRQGEPSFATHSNYACESSRARVERFDYLSSEQYFKGFNKGAQLTPLQYVLRRTRAPPKHMLTLEKGLVNKMTTRLQSLLEMLHPVTVEVIEPHDDVEGLLGKGNGGEICAFPGDGEAALCSPDTGDLQSIGVVIECHHVGAERRGGNRVPSLTTRDIEHLDARHDEPPVPMEPGARPLVLIQT